MTLQIEYYVKGKRLTVSEERLRQAMFYVVGSTEADEEDQNLVEQVLDAFLTGSAVTRNITPPAKR